VGHPAFVPQVSVIGGEMPNGNGQPFEIEWGKLGVLLTVVVCLTVLMALHTVDQTIGVGGIMAIVGYITGNGRLASRGKESVPAIGAPQPQRAVVEAHEAHAPLLVEIVPAEPHKAN
jgi:hypothetical protein